jgi:hypothetical protein
MSKWQSLSANRVSSFRHSGATPFSYCPSFPKNRIFATFFGVQEKFLVWHAICSSSLTSACHGGCLAAETLRATGIQQQSK